MPKKTKKSEAKKIRILQYRQARAILAIAALATMGKWPLRYIGIAKQLGLPKAAAEAADEIWNKANGADEGPETEECALKLVSDLLDMELDA